MFGIGSGFPELACAGTSTVIAEIAIPGGWCWFPMAFHSDLYLFWLSTELGSDAPRLALAIASLHASKSRTLRVAELVRAGARHDFL